MYVVGNYIKMIYVKSLHSHNSKEAMSIAIFSSKHAQQLIMSPNRKAWDGPFVYVNSNGGEVIVTAIFNHESFMRNGYGELDEANVKKYLRDNLYYLWDDIEYRGIVTQFKRYS